ncbi:RNA polymerase II holoenzyme cyclin-like subunit [Bienertia sinuspersici]
MVDNCVLEKIKKRCGFVNGICVSSRGNSGGLGFWWRDVDMVVISYSNHHCAANVISRDGGPCWRAMGIYGWPDAPNKHRTWDLISTLKLNCNIPWVIFGDFNEITSLAEKEGGASRGERQMDAFRHVIDDCHLQDLGYRGSVFTWQYGRTPSTLIRERLDRFLADEGWCHMFPNPEVRYFPVYRFDHALICLSTNLNVRSSKQGKSFRFEAMWLSHRDCWEYRSAGENCFCGTQLRKWASDTFGDIKRGIKKVEKELGLLLNKRPDQNMLDRCESLSNELDELHHLQESYWYARARANDLKDGDKITGYFHHKSSQRRKKNSIKGLYNPMGDCCEKQDEIVDIIENYFGGVFSSEYPKSQEEALVGIADLIDPYNGQWDETIVRNMFREDECKKILTIPLPSRRKEDSRYWWPMRDGVYTVKMGYWLAKSKPLGMQAEEEGEDRLWSKIWHVKGPLKMMHFLWRACMESLAVKEILFHRHTVNTQCALRVELERRQ